MSERTISVFNLKSDKLNYKFDYNADETKALRDRSYEHITIEDLRRIALWKLSRIVDVPDSLIERMRAMATTTELTVDSDQSRLIITDLIACDGVGFPMASSFLKFIRPDVYPIIDVRAYRALTGKRLRSNQYNLDLYLEYVRRIQDIANDLKIPLSIVDEQLYCFDKELNKGIDS